MGDYDTSFQLPKRVRLTVACVYLDNYYPKDDQGVIAKAKSLLADYGIQLALWPDNGQKFPFNTLKMSWDQVPHEPGAYRALRAAVDDNIKNNGCTFVIPLPVVFCQFQHPGHGITPPDMKKLTRACLISTSVNKDKITMVHEMGHAASLDHEHGDGHRGNIMHEAEPRSFMYRYQGERMAKAMFAVA